MEVSIRQHLEELLLGALVDTLADQVAFAVEHECPGSAIDVEESVDLAIRVDEHRRVIARWREVCVDRERCFVSY